MGEQNTQIMWFPLVLRWKLVVITVIYRCSSETKTAEEALSSLCCTFAGTPRLCSRPRHRSTCSFLVTLAAVNKPTWNHHRTLLDPCCVPAWSTRRWLLLGPEINAWILFVDFCVWLHPSNHISLHLPADHKPDWAPTTAHTCRYPVWNKHGARFQFLSTFIFFFS